MTSQALPESWAAPQRLDDTTWAALVGVWQDAPMMVGVVTGRDHVLVYVNRAVQQLFGPLRLGVPLVQAFAGMDLAALAAFDDVLESGRTIEVPAREVPIRDKGGSALVVRYVLSPLRVPGQPVLGVVMSGWDVTSQVRLERSSTRSRLLAEISERMNAASEPVEALQALTGQLVPGLAEVAAVYVVRDGAVPLGGSAEPVALALAPALEALGEPPRSDGPRPLDLERFPLAGPIIVPVSEGRVEGIPLDEALAVWLSAARVTSLAVLPLRVAGSLLGAVVLGAGADRRPYGPDDLPFLEDVAARAGAAVTHVRNVRRNHQVALDLQRAMMPAVTPVYSDRFVAARYIAGVEDVEVGGDWWDVIDIGGGQLALGVGDVSGRGVPAAVVMGQARAAMRAMSFAQLAPVEVLSVLDEQLAELVRPRLHESSPSPPRFVTALYAVFEPRTGALRASNAGHLPPLIRTPDGSVTVAKVQAGTPLGLQMGGWVETHLQFPAGSTLAMFTDGLVESRVQDVDDGIAALAEALQVHGPLADLDELAGALVDAMGRSHGHVDDVALLLMRSTRQAYPHATLDRVVSGLDEIPEVRRLASALVTSAGAGDHDVVDAVQHLVDELVANALEHAGTAASLHVHVTGVRVVVEVTDQGLTKPTVRRPDETSERGRGMTLTNALSSRWGVRSGPTGKTVWAEVLLPGARTESPFLQRS